MISVLQKNSGPNLTKTFLGRVFRLLNSANQKGKKGHMTDLLEKFQSRVEF